MRKMKVIWVITLLISANAFADCRAIRWPYADYPTKKSDLASALGKVPRGHALSYYLYEIEHLTESKGPQLKFARDLHRYLLNTSAGIKSRALIESVGQSSEIDSDHPESIAAREVCALKKQIDAVKETPDND
jgi:hypothetical protein